MDRELFKLAHDLTPKFNDAIVNGLAVRELRLADAYIDRIVHAAAKDFPPGLEYLGFRRCTPQEEQMVNTERLSGQTTLELARSDVFMIKILLSWMGEELKPCYLNLPFVNDGGITHIRGSVFGVSPVLADKAISVGPDNIFIPLNRDMLTFNKTNQHFYRDEERVTAQVVWSPIYHINKKKQGRAAARPAVKGFTTLVHYMFAKYGLSRTFAEFANAQVVVGNAADITPERYPPEMWTICSSFQRKPIGVKDRNYVGTQLKLAIPRAQYNLLTMNMIAGFFYIADHFPQRVEAEWIDEPRMWMILLGHLIFGGHGNEGKIADDVANHLKSLDGYLDNEAKLYLRSDDIWAEDVYGLFMYIIEKFSHLLNSSTGSVASMYDKRLMVLRYVLKDVTRGINKFMYRLNSNTKKQLTANDIRKIMDRFLKPNLVMGMNKGHGEVSSVSSPGDNKYFKLTSTIIPQTDSSGGRSRSKSSLADPSNLLHASIAEVGSFLTPGKSSPTGRGRVNPCLRVAGDGLIIRDPEKQPLLDRVQRRIQQQ